MGDVPEKIAEHRCFGGRQLRYRHASNCLRCDMTFSLFLPPQAESGRVPVLYWLSGLTCSDENFVVKAGAQRYAAELGIAIVAPDTSPRGDGVPDDPDGAYDFGHGAGFYVNATEPPWREHYRMYDYVTCELPAIVEAQFPLDAERIGISGHSMGGHGALTIGLRLPQRYRSMSAFSPVCAPMACPWGEKAFRNYLGGDREAWRLHDATELVAAAESRRPVLIDQGDADEFLAEQLHTERLVNAAGRAGYPMTIRMQAGYDHSYYFIATFIGEHLRFHARHLA